MSTIRKIKSALELRLDADPANPRAGTIYYNTVASEFRLYDGSSWQPFTTVADVNALIAAVEAGDVAYDNTSSTLTATDVQAAIDELKDLIDDAGDSQDVADLITLTGVAANETDLGTFTGDTIADSRTIKGALQDLETEVETKADTSVVDEIDANVNDLITLSGVAENEVDLGTFTGSTIADDSTIKSALQDLETEVELKLDASEKGAVNGVASLDANGKVPLSQLPNSIMEYRGTWDADTNTPTLANGAGNADTAIGDVYRVTVAGSTDFGAGAISFEIGDYAILNDSKIWEKAQTSEVVAGVSSINGEVGDVVLDSSDLDHSQANTANWTVADDSPISEHLDELASRVTTNEADISDRLEAVEDDTSPVLGGNLDLNDQTLEGELRRGTGADFVAEEYVEETLAGSATDSVVTSLSFDRTVIRKIRIEYVMVEATTGNVRTGELEIMAPAGSAPEISNDEYSESGNVDLELDWDLNLSTDTVQVRFTNGNANNKTLKADIKRFQA